MIDLISGCGSLVLGDNNTRIRVLLIFFKKKVSFTILVQKIEIKNFWIIFDNK